MTVSVSSLYYNNKKTYHDIQVSNPIGSSLASYVLLKRFYINQSMSYPEKLRVWLRFRNKFLQKLKKKNKGKLLCFYCSKNLTANHNNPLKSNFDGLATIDHYIPRAKKGKEYTESNLVCACENCNSLKKDMLPLEFYRLLLKNKTIINLNFVQRLQLDGEL